MPLRKVSADQNRIADLSALRELEDLRYLALVGNRIESAAGRLAASAGVECFANKFLRNTLALKSLHDLRKLISHGGLPAAEVQDFHRLRRDVEID